MTSTGYGGCFIQWGLPGDKPISGDFDLDGKADFSVWRSSNQRWYIRYSSFAGSVDFQFPTGNTSSSDLPDEGDVNNDGRSDIIHFRKVPSRNHLTFTRVYAGGTLTETQYNLPTNPAYQDTFFPAAGDYANHPNGNIGNDEMAVMHKAWDVNNNLIGAWCYRTIGPGSSGACFYTIFPVTTASTLVSGDFGGNFGTSNFADLVDWYPINGIWNLLLTNGTTTSTSWGNSGDIPMGADYTGDGLNDYVVFRPNYNGSGYSRWYFQLATCLSYMTPTGFGGCYLDWGLPGDEPVS